MSFNEKNHHCIIATPLIAHELSQDGGPDLLMAWMWDALRQLRQCWAWRADAPRCGWQPSSPLMFLCLHYCDISMLPAARRFDLHLAQT